MPEGVFAYETGDGTRYRFNAAGTSRRSFTTPEQALKAKGRFEERRGRGEIAVGLMRFDVAWARYLEYKRPRMTAGSYENLERDGRKHILPFFAERSLRTIDGAVVDDWFAPLAEEVADEQRAAKTVNNWRAHLSAFFEWCQARGRTIPVVINPCEFVEPLPVRESRR